MGVTDLEIANLKVITCSQSTDQFQVFVLKNARVVSFYPLISLTSAFLLYLILWFLLVESRLLNPFSNLIFLRVLVPILYSLSSPSKFVFAKKMPSFGSCGFQILISHLSGFGSSGSSRQWWAFLVQLATPLASLCSVKGRYILP